MTLKPLKPVKSELTTGIWRPEGEVIRKSHWDSLLLNSLLRPVTDNIYTVVCRPVLFALLYEERDGVAYNKIDVNVTH